MTRLIIHPSPCLWGWAGCQYIYSGGHACTRDRDHRPPCVCVCGARTRVSVATRRAAEGAP